MTFASFNCYAVPGITFLLRLDDKWKSLLPFIEHYAHIVSEQMHSPKDKFHKFGVRHRVLQLMK